MWDFKPSPKFAPTSSRVVRPEETEKRIRRISPQVPITRVVDLTPLDRIRLPVYSAVTPLGRDLTTHLGKGIDAVSARVGASMEAVERISAEQKPPGPVLEASFEQLSRRPGTTPVDPEELDLPDDSIYAPDRELSWIQGHDLIADQPVWVPADLVLNPPGEGILRDVDTNGLAAGNTLLEAIVHALCEVIERDVQSQLTFTSWFADPEDTRPVSHQLDLETLPAEGRPRCILPAGERQPAPNRRSCGPSPKQSSRVWRGSMVLETPST